MTHKTMHPSTYDYHTPNAKQIALMTLLLAAAKAYSDVLERELPEGPDKTYLIRKHRETAFWANVSATRLFDGTPRTD